jgi:ABC-2 type transport system permease protein
MRYKCRAMFNRSIQMIVESPFRVLSAVLVVSLIWVGLFALFYGVFEFVRVETFQGIVAIPLILDFFFVALMVMLVFSNGVICYGSLFARGEPSFLMSQPVRPSSVTLLKLIESLMLSSWSLILVGMPLMFALAYVPNYLPWYYYPYFAAFFLCFIPIPAAIGLAIAWAVGYWLTRIRRAFVAGVAAVTVAGAMLFFRQLWHVRELDVSVWLKTFFDRAGMLQGAFWPSTWVSRGLTAARNGEIDDAAFYLLVTFANALFVCWLVVRVVGKRLMLAYDRVQAGGTKSTYDGRRTRRIADMLFWYMGDPGREIALKDLRSFLRDPAQWSQQLILLGLLGLYVINIQNVPVKLDVFELQLLVSFLNLAAVSLLLATFTSRFVFPLISLEVQQLWLVGMLPMPRGRILFPKFAFALTITFFAGCAVMVLASQVGHTSFDLLLLDLVVVAALCVALCGMAVGLGGRFPMVGERNPARIASGLGGTINLAVSLGIVSAIMVLCFIIGFDYYRTGTIHFEGKILGCLGGIIAIATLSASMAMRLGARHFERLEC